MTIASELLALQQASTDGKLHCREVVEWARENPASALHSAIEWDDTKAAASYRIWQVRHLIELHITSGNGGPVLVSLSVDRGANGGYRLMSDVAAAPDLREIMLQDALAELERVQRKYSRITELARVWEEAEKVRSTKAHRRPKAA